MVSVSYLFYLLDRPGFATIHSQCLYFTIDERVLFECSLPPPPLFLLNANHKYPGVLLTDPLLRGVLLSRYGSTLLPFCNCHLKCSLVLDCSHVCRLPDVGVVFTSSGDIICYLMQQIMCYPSTHMLTSWPNFISILLNVFWTGL